MPEVLWCVSLEWGWKFWVPALVLALAVLAGLVVLIWRSDGSLTLVYEKAKVMAKGRGMAGAVIMLLIIGGGAYAIYEAYLTLKNAYFVSLNTPGRELEQVRNDIQSETHVEIDVKDPAKKFIIAGRYRGACASDMFESICRQYAPRIVCETSLWQRTLIVDLKKP
jgi:hypothetical protein